MARTIGIDSFRDAINDILEEYGDTARSAIEAATKETAKQVAKELQSAGDFNGGAEYRKGWTSRVELTRTGASAVVYNKAKPGLSHLLEFGHAKRNGGRTRAFNFIAPIDATIGDKFADNIAKHLGD